MKKWLSILILIFASALIANAQQTDCPPSKVCISLEQARQALIDSETVKAQATELAAKDQAIADLKAELANLRIELAKSTGEKTGAEQMVVRLTAIVDLLLKSTRKKSIGLVAF
jgi:ribosome maturation protein Sdo1